MVINIPTGKEKEIKDKLNGEFKKFMDETEEPRAVHKDNIGQFIATGKLKNPTNHHGSPVNTATVRSCTLKDNLEIKTVRWDCTMRELKIFRNCSSRVLKNWNK